MDEKTIEIKCACGNYLTCRPNGNGVVLCPTCGSAHTPEEFLPPPEAEEDEVIYL